MQHFYVLYINSLKNNFCCCQIYVFDFGPEMYVWSGKLAPTELRKTAASLAKDLWDQGYNYAECDINPLNASFGKTVLFFFIVFMCICINIYVILHFIHLLFHFEMVYILCLKIL